MARIQTFRPSSSSHRPARHLPCPPHFLPLSAPPEPNSQNTGPLPSVHAFPYPRFSIFFQPAARHSADGVAFCFTHAGMFFPQAPPPPSYGGTKPPSSPTFIFIQRSFFQSFLLEVKHTPPLILRATSPCKSLAPPHRKRGKTLTCPRLVDACPFPFPLCVLTLCPPYPTSTATRMAGKRISPIGEMSFARRRKIGSVSLALFSCRQSCTCLFLPVATTPSLPC